MAEVPVEALKERAWREVAAIDAALARGDIDEAGWHAANQALVVPAYLRADTPWGQSGAGGDAARWEAKRRILLRAVDRDGDLLDIGCANGYLMQTLHAWAAEDGTAVEPYGLDLSPGLAALARRRLPHWADRIWVGNALHWLPPRRFDYVRTGLEYVPRHRRAGLLRHLLEHAVGRRLVVGVHTEEIGQRALEEEVASYGYAVAGRHETAHDDPRVARRLFWIDA